MFSSVFHAALYQPIFNFFVGLYNLIPGHDVGLVILIITILVRILVWPLTSSSIRAQKSVQELQPKVDAVKKEFANDKQKQAEELMKVYKENKVNPFSSCLPLLVQLPILIALYMVMRDGLMADKFAAELYSFVDNPGKINPLSLGFLDMAKPNYVLAILAGLAQFWQAKTMLSKQPPKEAGAGGKDEGMMAAMNKQMLYFMPAMTAIIGFGLPAGLTVYWFFSTLLTVAQQAILLKKKDKKSVGDQKIIEGKIEEIK